MPCVAGNCGRSSAQDKIGRTLSLGQNARAASDRSSAGPETADPSTRSQTIADLSRGMGATSILAHRRVAGTTLRSREPHYREARSEEHTSELQSHHDLVCRLL